MTRPVVRNGLGLTVMDTDRVVQAIEAGMSLLPDNEAVYREWRRIVVQYNVSGVQVHDARLAAAMLCAPRGPHTYTERRRFQPFRRFYRFTSQHPIGLIPSSTLLCVGSKLLWVVQLVARQPLERRQGLRNKELTRKQNGLCVRPCSSVTMNYGLIGQV